jgi:hypothetical protein
MNLARPATELCDQALVHDLLFAVIHVARSTRSHGDSSLFPRLKESEPGKPHWDENYQSIPTRRARQDHQESQA